MKKTQTLDEKIGKKLNDIAFFSAWATSDIEYIKQAIKQSLLANMPEKRGSIPRIVDSVKGLVECDQWDMAIDECIKAIEEVLG